MMRLAVAIAALLFVTGYLHTKNSGLMDLSSKDNECIKDHDKLLSFHGSFDTEKLSSISDKINTLTFDPINLTNGEITFITGSYADRVKMQKRQRYFVRHGYEQSWSTGIGANRTYNEYYVEPGAYIEREYVESKFVTFVPIAAVWSENGKRYHYMFEGIDYTYVFEQHAERRKREAEEGTSKAEYYYDSGKSTKFEIEVLPGLTLKRFRIADKNSNTVFSGAWMEPDNDSEKAQMMGHFVRLAGELKQQCEKSN